MFCIPQEVNTAYDAVLIQNNVPIQQRAFYKKWLRYYWDFCHKYHFSTEKASSLPAFIEKLRSKHQSDVLCEQAKQAVLLYFSLCNSTAISIKTEVSVQHSNSNNTERVDLMKDESRYKVKVQPAPVTQSVNEELKTYSVEANEVLENSKPIKDISSKQAVYETQKVMESTSTNNIIAVSSQMKIPTELKQTGANWVSIYDNLKAEIKLRHYSPKTFTSYRAWVRKFQAFLKSKDSRLISQQDVKAFLTDLAVEKKVAASTQNQAFNALLFLFRHVLKVEFGEIKDVPRAKRSSYIPVVLSRPEVDIVFSYLREPFILATKLLYGCGLRISECLNLRLQDFNLDQGLLTVRHSKGKKSRVVPLPQTIMPDIKRQIEVVSALFDADIATGYAGVFLPDRLEEKYKNAAKEFSWQWFFPAKTLTFLTESKEYKRYHLHDTQLQKGIKAAVKSSKLLKRVTAHTFRHSFASHLLQANYDIRTIQVLMGHSDVKTTMIYLQTVPDLTLKEAKSPLDF